MSGPVVKASNPKDAIGSRKLMLHVVPSTVDIYAALGFTEGALKYGKFNWRVAGVRLSVYLDAMQRHIAKLANGQWADPVTRVPHVASIICCAGIIADANEFGMLADDRAPNRGMGDEYAAMIDSTQEIADHLRKVFKKFNPEQYTVQHDNAETTTPEEATRVARTRSRKPGNRKMVSRSTAKNRK